MANNNVRFYFGSLSKYQDLTEKNPLALYFVEDESTGFRGIYKGDQLIAVGSECDEFNAGLMTPVEKAKLSVLPESAVSNLVPVDGTLVIADTANGEKSIAVAISNEVGNILIKKNDGLYVDASGSIDVPSYSIEKQTTAEDGYSASYKLAKTVGDDKSYVGDVINIPKDMVLESAVLEVVTESDVPYVGAIIGDPYIKMTFNDAARSSIYVPVKDLADIYIAGNGIEIVDNKVSVKIADKSNGLVAVDGALSIALATKDTAGALSAVDKAFIESIPNVYASKKFVNATCEQTKYEITSTPEGTLINYGEKEIRVMCPADAEFTKQQVGNGGDANTYYMTFKIYVPNDNVAGYIEHLGDQVDKEILTSFSTDEYGRRYQSTWLGLAKYDETTGVWNYYGANSSINKYIGWDYQIDWYDTESVMIASDNIRINLSNENCHNINKPYYMANYATIEQIEAVQEAYSWGEL